MLDLLEMTRFGSRRWNPAEGIETSVDGYVDDDNGELVFRCTIEDHTHFSNSEPDNFCAIHKAFIKSYPGDNNGIVVVRDGKYRIFRPRFDWINLRSANRVQVTLRFNWFEKKHKWFRMEDTIAEELTKSVELTYLVGKYH